MFIPSKSSNQSMIEQGKEIVDYLQEKLVEAQKVIQEQFPKQQKLETIQKLDIYDITGTWYEIARIDEFYETKLCNTTISFTVDEKKAIRVVFGGNFEKFNGERYTYEGLGYQIEYNSPRIDIQFVPVLKTDYNVIKEYSGFQQILIGTQSRKYAWFLSKTLHVDDKVKEDFLRTLKNQGFNVHDIKFVEHQHII